MEFIELLKSLDAPLTILGAAYVIYLGNQRLSTLLDHQQSMFDKTIGIFSDLLRDCIEGDDDGVNS